MSESPRPPERPAAYRLARRGGRWRLALLWMLVGAVALAVSFGIVFWMAAYTEPGARWIFDQLERVLPGQFEVEELSGPATGPLRARGFKWETETLEIYIEELAVEWRLYRLLTRQVDIQDLHARGVRVWIKSVEERDEELRELHLRWNVVLRRALIEDIVIYRPEAEEPVVIDRLELDTAELGDFLQVTRFEVWSPHVDAQVAGTLRPRGDYDVNLEVGWVYRPPDLPELQGRGTLTGTLRELRLRQRLTAPFVAEVDGTLYDPLYDLRFALATTFEGLDPQLFAPEAPALIAAGRANLEGRSLRQLRARGRLSARTEEWGTVDADFRLDRDDDLWRFQRLELQRPREPTLVVIEGSLRAVDPAVFRGVVRWQDMRWPLEGEPWWRSPEATLQISGNLERYVVQVDALLATERLPVGHYVISARGGRESAEIQRLEGRLLDGVVRGSGRVRWEPALSYRLDLVADGLDLEPIWPQLPPEVARASRWEVLAEGTAGGLTAERMRVDLLDGRVRGRATVQWEPLFTWTFAGRVEEIDPSRVWPQVPAELAPGSYWELDLRGTDVAMNVRRLQGRVLDGELSASGEVGWDPRVRWDLEILAQGIAPQVLWPEWPGRLDAVGRSAGVLFPDGPRGTLALDRVRGELRGRPLDGEAALVFREAHWDLDHLALTWGPAHLVASGDVGRTLDVQWRLVSLEVGAVLEEGQGVLEATGRLTGPRAAPRVVAALSGTELVLGGFSAAELVGYVDIDSRAGGSWVADLEGNDLLVAGRRAENLLVQLRGTREDHRLVAAAVASDGQLDLSLAGGFMPSWDWSGLVSTLRLESERMGVWDLQAPAPLLAATDRVAVGDFCWASGEASLCGFGSWHRGGPLEVVAALDELPLTLVEPWVPDDLRLEGAVDGNVVLGSDALGRLVGELELRPEPGATLAPWGRPEAALTLAGGDLLLRAFPDGIVADFDLRFEEEGWARGSLELPDYVLGRGLADQALGGSLEARLADIRFLEGMIPVVSEPQGRLELDLVLAGTLGAPDYTGSARLLEGSGLIPRYGLELEEVELAAVGDGAGPLQVQGSLRSGPGTLEIGGTLHLFVAPERPVRLTLAGSGMEVLDNELGRVLADFAIELVYDRERVELNGDVFVPEARLTHQTAEPGAVTTSPDVVYTTAAPEVVPPAALALHARLRVVLGDEVYFEARGVETRVVGSLLVLESPGRPTRGIGELQSRDGTVALYGRALTIDQGRLVFAGGPVTEPLLYVRASRTAPGAVIAGVEVRGTPQSPEVTLWSEPAMSESEVLSYLVLGRPWGEETEPDVLGRAATTLGLQAGQLIAQELGARLGLQEVAIVTEEGLEEAILVLGTYLSPRLFVAYGIGLFEPVSIFRVRYLIDHRWTAQAEAGGLRTGGDLLYTVERGGPARPLRLPRPESLEEVEATPVPEPRDAPEGSPRPTPDDDEEDDEDASPP